MAGIFHGELRTALLPRPLPLPQPPMYSVRYSAAEVFRWRHPLAAAPRGLPTALRGAGAALRLCAAVRDHRGDGPRPFGKRTHGGGRMKEGTQGIYCTHVLPKQYQYQ